MNRIISAVKFNLQRDYRCRQGERRREHKTKGGGGQSLFSTALLCNTQVTVDINNASHCSMNEPSHASVESSYFILELTTL